MTRTLVPISLVVITMTFSHVSLAQSPGADSSKSGDPTPTQDPIGQPFQLGDTVASPAIRELQESRTLRSENFFSSPTGTLLKSVVFPGWGQWANGKKQKAAVYFGLESYWITKSLIWRHRAQTAETLAEFSHARDRRNYFYWLTGITVFVSMFDAYADRYLLTLERTRNMPDDFWGQDPEFDSRDDLFLALAIKF